MEICESTILPVKVIIEDFTPLTKSKLLEDFTRAMEYYNLLTAGLALRSISVGRAYFKRSAGSVQFY